MLGESKKAVSDFEYAKEISLGIQNDSDLYNLAANEINKLISTTKTPYEPPYDPPKGSPDPVDPVDPAYPIDPPYLPPKGID